MGRAEPRSHQSHWENIPVIPFWVGKGSTLGSEQCGKHEAWIFPVIPVKLQTEKVYPHGIPNQALLEHPKGPHKGQEDLSHPRVVVAPPAPGFLRNLGWFGKGCSDGSSPQPRVPWITHSSPLQGRDSFPRSLNPRCPCSQEAEPTNFGYFIQNLLVGSGGSYRDWAEFPSPSHPGWLSAASAGTSSLEEQTGNLGMLQALCIPLGMGIPHLPTQILGNFAAEGSQNRQNSKPFPGIPTPPPQSKTFLRGNPALSQLP